MPIPQLPGRLIPRHSDEENGLKSLVGRMCHLENDRSCIAYFPIDHAKLTNNDFLLDFLEASLSVLVLRI